MEPLKLRRGLTSEFDAFLYEPIVEDGETMPVTVLSALARLDLDPWEEAATLASLPPTAAARQLESRIEKLPAMRAAGSNCAAVTAHLLALLPPVVPRTAAVGPTSSAGISPSAPTVERRFVLSPYVIYVLFMLLALGAQWFMASPPAHTTVASPSSPTPAAHLETTSPPSAHP